MPTFDSSTSQLSRLETDLLRSVLGPGKPRSTSLRRASRARRWRQARAKLARALVAVVLLGGFVGPALVMGGSSPVPGVATRTLPAGFDPATTGSVTPAGAAGIYKAPPARMRGSAP